jgi:hypothetical protein
MVIFILVCTESANIFTSLINFSEVLRLIVRSLLIWDLDIPPSGLLIRIY